MYICIYSLCNISEQNPLYCMHSRANATSWMTQIMGLVTNDIYIYIYWKHHISKVKLYGHLYWKTFSSPELSLQWRLLRSHLYRRTSKKASKLRIICLCEGNPPVAGGFPVTKGQWRGKCFHLMTSSCDKTISDATSVHEMASWRLSVFTAENIPGGEPTKVVANVITFEM